MGFVIASGVIGFMCGSIVAFIISAKMTNKVIDLIFDKMVEVTVNADRNEDKTSR